MGVPEVAEEQARRLISVLQLALDMKQEPMRALPDLDGVRRIWGDRW